MAKIDIARLRVRAYHRGCFMTSHDDVDFLWNAEPKSIRATWQPALFPGEYNWLPAVAIKSAPRPPIPQDVVEVFPNAPLRVLFATRPDVELPEHNFVFTSDWAVGSLTQGAKSDWPYSRVRDVVLEHLTQNLLNAGTVPSWTPVALPQDLRPELLGFEKGGADVSVTYDESVRKAMLTAINEEFLRTQTGYTIALNTAEPQVDRRKGRNGHADVVITSSQSAITVEAKGTGYVDVDVKLFAVAEGSGRYKLYGVLPPGMNTTSDAARLAAEGWDAQYKRALIQKTEGRAVTMPPAERPPATASADLLPEERAHYDTWWSRSSQLRAALANAPSRTEDDGWADYVSRGGTSNRGDWNAAAKTRENAAAALPNDGFLSGLGTALGWAGDKVADGVGWLGKSALDLLKTWGPTGTLQVYGGVKAVNAVTDNSSSFQKFLPWIIAGGVLLWIAK